MGIVGEMIKNHEFYQGKLDMVRPSVCKQYGETLGLDQPQNEWASIGILSILHLLNKYEKLHLYGFNYELNKHYFSKQPKDSKYHNSKKEAGYLDKLVKEGRCILI